jgi:hypothetical protein
MWRAILKIKEGLAYLTFDLIYDLKAILKKILWECLFKCYLTVKKCNFYFVKFLKIDCEILI